VFFLNVAFGSIAATRLLGIGPLSVA